MYGRGSSWGKEFKNRIAFNKHSVYNLQKYFGGSANGHALNDSLKTIKSNNGGKSVE
jgi:hypothetical protein